ncbi:flagellin domain-containing protein [Methylophaga lonarensis MPL]|uniref:Flagellin n=1 Tax=Methylophaga lonarensis MPL TaxID=1286106 RepID=M7NZP1_9GAMM|nr:flagellin [Methylophaga lonarensis]EMR14288.1 flagellin domain-containing protein [Methylophaga lonarensis MPL]
MALIINTNVSSLNAQRNLTGSQGSLATSLERLSSGLRINSAKDDAAGLAISERFTSQIRGLNQAIRNANDGISFAQTAEGALGTIGDALQRIRELSVQAVNDSNSSSDRRALNDEVQQLISEIGRVANATEFNGQRILDGSLSNLFFQIGANQGQNIAVDGVDARSTELGAATVTGAEGMTQSQINDFDIASIDDITITLNRVGVLGEDTDLEIDIEVDLSGVTTLEDAVREINTAIQDFTGDPDDVDAVRKAGLSAALIVDNAGNTTITIRGAFDSEFVADGGTVTLDDEDDTEIAMFDEDDSAQSNLTDIDVSDRFGAAEALAIVDGALTQVNSLRAELGAVQLRFESTIANLSISSENLSASRSRILDADFAAETANLTRAQILQQAGTAMLAQANALPQNVLSLL